MLVYRILFILALISSWRYSSAQIVSLSPSPASAEQEVVLTFDATQGNAGLVGVSSVYAHLGVIISGPSGNSWTHVVGNWGMDDGVGKMTPVEGQSDKWAITLSPTIRDYFSVPGGTNIFRLAMVFRNADGSKKGAGIPGSINGGEVAANGDIFLELNINNYALITAPIQGDVFLSSGEALSLRAETSSIANQLSLYIDTGSGFGDPITSVNNARVITFDMSPPPTDTVDIKVVGIIGTDTVVTLQQNIVHSVANTLVENPPAGIIDGINYLDDSTKVILSLLAPGKQFVYAVGDFNNWSVDNNYLMNKSTDGEHFWIEIIGLTPGKEYVFQYWVDGTLKIGDPFADKVADPWNDAQIPSTVYPNLISYSNTDNGIATTFQTNQPAYTWSGQEGSWQSPPKEDLVIYELLLRDFLGGHNYEDLADTIGYIKSLGVNAIELMPIMEFEGNESWGYNPTYYFAPDKYYGSKNDLKTFIDLAHQEGIAVILDMVLNHAFGQNAMVKMYFNDSTGMPTADNPWFNQQAPHPFSVGFDFNHESPYTQAFVDTVNYYWLSEYHVDGYRFDLSKGFTQNTGKDPNDVNAWGQYDQSRIDILTRMAEKIWLLHPSAYVILEHFADPSEESVLASKGMILWANGNNDYGDALTGITPGRSLDVANSKEKVAYMESHDEQRIMWKLRNSGVDNGYYDISNPRYAYERAKLGAAFLFTVPGPKMLWMFQELGYDIDINFNDRVGEKPLPWGNSGLGYYQDPDRQEIRSTYSSIISLVEDHSDVFHNGNFTWNSTGEIKQITIEHPNMDVVIIGNFGTQSNTINPQFTQSATWYDFFSADSISVTIPSASINLQPGEFHIYTTKKLASPPQHLVHFSPVVRTEPMSFKAIDVVKIIFDASVADQAGTAGLLGTDKVYMHSGVILNDPDSTGWSNIVGNLTDDGVGQMTKVSGTTDQWEITITPRDYYNVPEGTRIYRLAMYFRDGENVNLGKEIGGGDVFIPVLPDVEERIVTVDPPVFYAQQRIHLVFDAALADPSGTPGLKGASKVYIHSGAILDGPASTFWNNVVGNWGMDDGVGQMTKVEGESDKWEISFIPQEYFGVPQGTRIFRIGMVFRNEDGSSIGKGNGEQDIFFEVSDVITSTDDPLEKRDILIYPNPNKGQFQIVLKQGDEIQHVVLVDSQGKIVKMAGPLKENIYKNSYSIDLPRIKSGLYILRLEKSDGSFANSKILIR